MFLPHNVALCLLGFLDVKDRNALVRAYPTLVFAYAKFQARARPWQSRMPVELMQAVMAFLTPSDFYAACCTCAFWRACGTSNARLVKAHLVGVMDNSYSSAMDLALVSPIPDDVPAQRMWLYFLVAAPRRYMFMDGMRRYRVATLDFRQPLRAVDSQDHSRSAIYVSDYGGILAAATPSSLSFYSIEDMLPGPPRLAANAHELGTLAHPRGVAPAQLVDVSIAHQQGTTGTFSVFALYDGGSVFHATFQLLAIPETHFKQATFTKFSLVYGGPPTATAVACDWSTDPPPAYFRADRLAAVALASPARTLLSLHGQDATHIAIIRPAEASALSPPPLRSKRSRAALDFIRRKSRNALARSGHNANAKPWDILALAYPELVSTDWRAHQVDRLAVKEVFLEWLHPHAHVHSNGQRRVPVLKSTDVATGAHLALEGLTPLAGTLSPKGLKFVAGAPLAPPPDVGGAPPTLVTALQYVQRWLLVAAYWPQTSCIYLYDGLPTDFLAGRLAPRKLVRFGAQARVQALRFVGGYTSAPDEPPCAGKIVLTATMAEGFVHLCQFTAMDMNGQVEWAVPASCKLQGVGVSNTWPSAWVARPDGTMRVSD